MSNKSQTAQHHVGLKMFFPLQFREPPRQNLEVIRKISSITTVKLFDFKYQKLNLVCKKWIEIKMLKFQSMSISPTDSLMQDQLLCPFK